MYFCMRIYSFLSLFLVENKKLCVPLWPGSQSSAESRPIYSNYYYYYMYLITLHKSLQETNRGSGDSHVIQSHHHSHATPKQPNIINQGCI